MVKIFFITTAIDYPSGRFHLGHAYEKITTDVLARWKRFQGYKVHFSTGTDCHGLKIERAAAKAGKTPLDFVTELSDGFKELCKVLNISYDDFVMTIEPRHKVVAQYVINQLYEKGDIYKGNYEGLYCVDCENYYTEKDLVNNRCPVHKSPVELLKEESYFFKLSKYQDFLIMYIKSHPESIWPEKKRNEILNRLEQPLRDLSISRKSVTWGIPLPFDASVSEFVWVEALNNYLTTVHYPDKEFQSYWPAVHCIGSDIVWFHTVIWFSILKSLELKMPKVMVHGFINFKGEKLSKSSNLGSDPIALSERYGSDALRYFLIREIPFGDDGDFSEEALKNRVNNELANDLGNLVSRVSALCEKNFKEIKQYPIDEKLSSKFDLAKISALMDSYKIHDALSEIWGFVKACNKHVNDEKLWELEGKEQEKHLYTLLESIRVSALVLSPFIPETSERIFKQLGKTSKKKSDAVFGKVKSYKIKKGEILFKKIIS